MAGVCILKLFITNPCNKIGPFICNKLKINVKSVFQQALSKEFKCYEGHVAAFVKAFVVNSYF
jgi:hypothetical protein